MTNPLPLPHQINTHTTRNALTYLWRRFLCGVAVGSDLVVSTAYVAEISKRDVRGALGFLVQLMGALGVLYTFALGCFLDWKWLAAANAAWAAPFWVAVLASPESPRWLLARGRQYSASKVAI